MTLYLSYYIDGPYRGCHRVEVDNRLMCGWTGITESECVDHANCCWDESHPDTPSCFFGQEDGKRMLCM